MKKRINDKYIICFNGLLPEGNWYSIYLLARISKKPTYIHVQSNIATYEDAERAIEHHRGL